MVSLQIQNNQFVDEHARTLMLRGVNLAGSSKIPFAPRAEPDSAEFFQHRDVSFVGRPFSLQDADEHFERLRAWGLTFLRFVVTWEAIAHRGPDEYDNEYLDYVRAVLEKAGEYGFQVLIDPHQDVWSRFTGGDGAPGWTLEAVGFDIKNMTPTGAAMLHHTHPRRPPLLVWATNYARLAPATMFTLFYAGNDFAPATSIDGIPAQEFLQSQYIAAISKLAERLRDVNCVVGYEVMNEPSRGYIGWRNLFSSAQYRYWITPSPMQGMWLGAGFPQRVWWKMVNRERARAWLPGRECIWKQNGVWDTNARGEPRLLRPNHFSHGNGQEKNFARDYYPAFAKRFARAIQTIDPRALIFVQGEPGEPAPALHVGDIPNMVYAPHWYDGITLMVRRYWNHLGADMLKRRLVLGADAVQRSFAAQLAVFRHEAEKDMGGVPVLLGEFGIPFDLRKPAVLRQADEMLETRALDRSFRALETNLLSGTIWNYSPDNTFERGDSFNGEDLSIFTQSERVKPDDIHSGGRALRTLIRPYPRATAGKLLRVHFDWRTRVFDFSFEHDEVIAAPTEIFVPTFQYPRGIRVEVSDGAFDYDAARQILTYRHDASPREHHLHLAPAG
jgi:hypothetical protein